VLSSVSKFITALFARCNQNEVIEDEMDRVCRMNGEKRNAYRIFVGKAGGKRSLGGHRRMWDDNIKVDLREVWFGLDLSGLE
jgi:hypothetical protein